MKEEAEIPWVEKYRPTSLDEVASQKLTIQTLKEFVQSKQLPHFIFAGPAGTGKTSAAWSLIYDMVGKDNFSRDMVLEKNASDESRMQDLPSIKNFVKHNGMVNYKAFKFVILDESDNLSKAVQSAFRRIIETAPSNVKFIFMCNYVEKIIDPILSRCTIFRFYPLPKPDFEEQMEKVIKAEKISITPDVLDAIYFISRGDMRRAINLLQISVAIHQDDSADKGIIQKINPDTIYEISGYLSSGNLEKVLSLMRRGEFITCSQILQNIRGLSSRGLFLQLLDKLANGKHKTHNIEQILIRIAEYDYRLSLQASHQIQIDGCIAELSSLLSGGGK